MEPLMANPRNCRFRRLLSVPVVMAVTAAVSVAVLGAPAPAGAEPIELVGPSRRTFSVKAKEVN